VMARGEGVGGAGAVELLQLADEFGGTRQADSDRLPAGLLGPLPGGVGFPLAGLSRWALSGLWLASSQ